jgi:hypothetical protein
VKSSPVTLHLKRYIEEAKNLPSALLCKGWVTGRRKCPENDIGLSLYHDYINDKRTL